MKKVFFVLLAVMFVIPVFTFVGCTNDNNELQSQITQLEQEKSQLEQQKSQLEQEKSQLEQQKSQLEQDKNNVQGQLDTANVTIGFLNKFLAINANMTLAQVNTIMGTTGSKTSNTTWIHEEIDYEVAQYKWENPAKTSEYIVVWFGNDKARHKTFGYDIAHPHSYHDYGEFCIVLIPGVVSGA
ncbi:MAG: hypothetical protein FWE53_04515 [Firmicutes bacterium]|nr:hypothetical protein [Bacillota bacterium]